MPISLIHARRLCRQLINGLGGRPTGDQVEDTMAALMRRPRNLAEAEEWVRDIIANQGPFPTPGELHRRSQRGKEGRGKKAKVGCQACAWTGWVTTPDGAAACPRCRRAQPPVDRRTESAEPELAHNEDAQ
jgi:hypothetical protein